MIIPLYHLIFAEFQVTDHFGGVVKEFCRRNTLVDVIRVAKARTSCEYLPIDTNFVSILLLVSVLFSRTC